MGSLRQDFWRILVSELIARRTNRMRPRSKARNRAGRCGPWFIGCMLLVSEAVPLPAEASEPAAWQPPPAMSTDEIQRVYVTERREVLRAFFKDRPLLPAAPITADNPLCQDFVRDFTAQNEAVELIAPIVVAHDYADPELVAHLFDRCPDLELRSYKIGKSGPAVGPRNFLLYRADIDNDASNGEELSLLEEVMSKRQPVYGAEIVASSTFRLVDLEHCTTRGFVGIGALRRYPVDFDVSGEDPQTALYGVFRYQGSTYLYSVIDSDPKAPPLELTAFDPSGFGSFNRLCKYINGRLKN